MSQKELLEDAASEVGVGTVAGMERDLYRDTWVRYLGYANEVGESFRSLVDIRVVKASYAVALAYVLADTLDKSWKMKKTNPGGGKVLIAAGDALIWQTLASVVIPGYVINRICAGSLYGLCRYTKLPLATRRWATVGVGLVSIPFIVHPIDDTVTIAMDYTYRKII